MEPNVLFNAINVIPKVDALIGLEHVSTNPKDYGR
jgi:hypothetical protein